MDNIEDLLQRLSQFRTVKLAELPTPFEKLENLSEKLERFEVLLKRDDQTGLAFGGNKARKLDYIIADALHHGADTIVTWAGIQSNWCRQVAAATARVGLKSKLVLFRGPTSPPGCDGNLLLSRMFDADIRIVDGAEIDNMMELENVREYVDPAVEEVKAAGNTPYLAPIGGSLIEGSMAQPWGAISYVRAFAELFDQAKADGLRIDSIVMATGSGSTQAGLLVGAKLLSPGTRVVGVSVYASKSKMFEYVRSVADATISLLGAPIELNDDDIIVFDEYIRAGYGVFNEDVGNALHMVAETEGVLLDPVYTGKAMVGMLDLMDKDYFGDGEHIVFLHSGGTPALFPYRDHIAKSLDEA